MKIKERKSMTENKKKSADYVVSSVLGMRKNIGHNEL